MIVKNEACIIESCLNSVKNIVDCISICDTGSTDNTIAIIEQFMHENGIPGEVHRHSWQNFGYNRTLSAQAARSTLEKFGFSLPQTYLLLLDADMTLSDTSIFKRDDLQADSYLVLQKSASHSYYNLRLLRASLPWECVGLTHEYWSCKHSIHPSKRLHTLVIDDHENGGCKEDKFERDIKLLAQGLKDEPDNDRYMFYYAQSHKCLKQYEEAIRWYKKRIAKGGWKEEVWYSKYMIGECYEDMGYWDHALRWYLEAYQYNPYRAETLQKIATHYRLKGENNLAYLFAKQGSGIRYPSDQILFVSHSVYDYQFDEELSIAAYYTPFKEEGYAAVNRLLLKKNIPESIKDRAHKNSLFYVENLKNARFQPIAIELPLIREGSTERYRPMNPSIQKTEEGYQLICRTVNYSQVGGREYRSRDVEDETIRTKNFFVCYNRDFKLLSQHEIVEDLPRQRVESSIRGLEDCRLVRLDKENWFVCTTYDTSPDTIAQSLCQLADRPSNSIFNVEKLIPLKLADSRSCEKNWLPFTDGNTLHVIYAYDPFSVYKLNKETGECTLRISYEPACDFTRFRGSAAPIEFDEGFLLLTHEVVFNDQRSYLHRFLYLDKDFVVKKLSKPFTFLHKGIEYCCGMTGDHSGNTCILSIGIEDREAYLCFVGFDTIRSLLEPIPSF